MTTLLFGVALCGVVDRIEGDFAVVEWADGRSYADVPLVALPVNIDEGDRLFVPIRAGEPGPVLPLGSQRSIFVRRNPC